MELASQLPNVRSLDISFPVPLLHVRMGGLEGQVWVTEQMMT